MIVIGSYAAELNGIHLRKEIKDIDIYGSTADLERFRAENRDVIVSEKLAHGCRWYFTLRNAGAYEKVEFDIGRTPSDLLLEELGDRTARVLGSDVRFPPPNVLFLIKRAHANRPVHFDKTADDLLALAPHLTKFTTEEQRYYRMLRRESDHKLATTRFRFTVGVHDDDLQLSDHAVPIYDHADVLRAISAGEPSPAHSEKKGRSPIDEDIFNALSLDAKGRAMQELFLAIGIERFHAFNPAFRPERVYRRGMHKAMRDLLPTAVQDFCLDNLAGLSVLPDSSFLRRFEAAVIAGKVATISRPPPPPGPAQKSAWALLAAGDPKVRALCEDLVRRSELPGDPVALHILGILLARRDKKDLAEQCFRKSLFIRRQNPRAWAELGVLLRSSGRHIEAKECLEEAVAQGTSSAEVFVELGLVNEALDAPESARAAYASALKLKPKLATARERLDTLSAQAPPG